MTTAPDPIRVLIAEDHTIVRQGLIALLGTEHGIQIVGEAADGHEAVASTLRLKPHVVLMDLAMPGMNGVEATRAIKKDAPDTAVLILSMHAAEEHVRPAVRAGATGYLLKGSGLSDLVSAIRAVASGEAFLSPTVAKILLRDAQAEEEPSSNGPLTAREREILQLVGEGSSSPEIARSLHLSVKTVEGHRSRIMAKLNLHDVAGLVRYAIRVGLVSPDK
ncbi:MAG: response regulator transcription factor [Polyangiaceae bacterium]